MPRRLNRTPWVPVILAAMSAAPAAASAEARESRFKEWGENPFVSDRKPAAVPAATSPGGLTLNGILWDERNPCAVLNNQVVEVGDRVGTWEVVAIEKGRVVVSNGAETQTLEAP